MQRKRFQDYANNGEKAQPTFSAGEMQRRQYGREAGLEPREDYDTVLEPNMVISMEPMITLPHHMPGAGGYRELATGF